MTSIINPEELTFEQKIYTVAGFEPYKKYKVEFRKPIKKTKWYIFPIYEWMCFIFIN